MSAGFEICCSLRAAPTADILAGVLFLPITRLSEVHLRVFLPFLLDPITSLISRVCRSTRQRHSPYRRQHHFVEVTQCFTASAQSMIGGHINDPFHCVSKKKIYSFTKMRHCLRSYKHAKSQMSMRQSAYALFMPRPGVKNLLTTVPVGAGVGWMVGAPRICTSCTEESRRLIAGHSGST